MSATKPIGRASWTMLGQKKHGCSWSPKTWKKFTILKKQPPPGQVSQGFFLFGGLALASVTTGFSESGLLTSGEKGRNTYTLHQQRSNGVVVTGPGRSRMNDSPYSRTPTMPLQELNHKYSARVQSYCARFEICIVKQHISLRISLRGKCFC